MYLRATLTALAVATRILAQEIVDVWTTTRDLSELFQYAARDPPARFGAPDPSTASTATAHIAVDDTQILQPIYGFGATLTDSAAATLSAFKASNAANYDSLLMRLFDPTDSNTLSAGMSYLRVPFGATDFSASLYSYDDTSGDTSLASFSIDVTPPAVFDVLKDILSLNPAIKVHFVPWSPPGWMKDSGTMTGGSFNPAYSDIFANYLFKALQAWQAKGVTAYAISIQNEPENSNPTYPTCLIPASVEAQIGTTLRALMDNNGFGSTKIIGYDHNWDDAGGYPVDLMNTAQNVFAGVSFHCYRGTVDEQSKFTAAWPNKEVYFTECAGTIGSDFWADLKWNTHNIILGSQEHGASTGLFWVLAGDPSGGPKLPGTDSCGGRGCRPVVTIDVGAGTYTLNTEYYAAAHASKATIPKDVGGPLAQKIASSVDSGFLRVGAYVSRRADAESGAPERYSLVVMNWADSGSGTPIETTIGFRDVQATYTFPVGLTTLMWYADRRAQSRRELRSAVDGHHRRQRLPHRKHGLGV